MFKVCVLGCPVFKHTHFCTGQDPDSVVSIIHGYSRAECPWKHNPDCLENVENVWGMMSTNLPINLSICLSKSASNIKDPTAILIMCHMMQNPCALNNKYNKSEKTHYITFFVCPMMYMPTALFSLSHLN